MNKQSFIARFKEFIASLGWKLFIWGNGTTEENYWEQIYHQEAAHRREVRLVSDDYDLSDGIVEDEWV